ncbi:hypothetical protein IVB14_13125 [Bradyrhizobium sp. 180]|uniref:hypothetical protein n=1 Tax=unclassified Bradyrhizobium TaxID=2631580 RepID=UPI001FFB885A|nr:hypothetical protein [Bradyrhizobium sp. CW12]MCK1491331.1 hypothetical protein [Bradyrhizobium sp. 180]MCK1528055.1 hypothetical protein [Bradyrhizobium sp. 182]MCK1597811.1 hypothetical protein [Bradyrhizobium sp. 164]MCK1616744.1 hypothetical protein [Bradyrhizobium sp. 159]MCK1648209.1 hypothetical protein [Bradyrhizobium sp. 154]MCK1753908.1 hypothetical protein [Bradyrhizobium sp. 137]
MSNWIDSGGVEPRLYSVRPANCKSERRRSGTATRWRSLIRLACALGLSALAASFGHARDRGQFANTNPDLKAWFDGLRSGKGPCCSDADGSAVSDSDWDSKDGHYRVRIPRYGSGIDGQPQELVWVDVPEEAVISEPNRVGRTMVWPIYGPMGVTIRCFMPGSMT